MTSNPLKEKGIIMVDFNSDRFSDAFMRENPKNADEIELADQLAAHEVSLPHLSSLAPLAALAA